MTTKKDLVGIISKGLSDNQNKLKLQFNKQDKKVQTRYFFLDDLLPDNISNHINKCFLGSMKSWREINSLREKKLTTKQLQDFPELIKNITFALQSKKVIEIIQKITLMNNLIGDEKLYAGGLSMMRKGDFLNPHYDNSHDSDRKLFRRLNLLYYVTPDWAIKDGGNLELWDREVKEKITITSTFNRLVVMETNQYSWHSVSKVIKENYRCCVSNYYFSNNSPTGNYYFHITGFHGKPKEYFKRILLPFDSMVRNYIRKLFFKGFSKKDYYTS